MMKKTLPNGMWLSCPTRPLTRWDRWVRRAKNAGIEFMDPEYAVFWIAAFCGIGGTFWLAGSILFGVLTK